MNSAVYQLTFTPSVLAAQKKPLIQPKHRVYSSGAASLNETCQLRVCRAARNLEQYAAVKGMIMSKTNVVGFNSVLYDVPDESGTGDIVVDPKTHIVWIAYRKGDQCFVQPFTPTK